METTKKSIAQMLLEALIHSKAVIKKWHGDFAFDIYDRQSPEMKQINEALRLASEPAPEDGSVPISIAEDLAIQFQKDQVIILTWSNSSGSESVTTWGKTIHDSDQAAAGGNEIKKVLGWPDEYCNAISAKVVEILSALEIAKEDLQNLIKLTNNERFQSPGLTIIDEVLDKYNKHTF